MTPPIALAVTALGLAPWCAAELRALGLVVHDVDDAGVTFEATPDALARAHVGSAIASRIIVRLAAFEARGFAELERHARRVPWGRVVTPGRRVRLRVTSGKSKLYHTEAIAERLWPALAAQGAEPAAPSSATDDERDDDAPGDDTAQLIVVRVHRDVVTISADASGALLHRRGWRLATAKAPMRETLAAALLAAAGYDGTRPLVDPMAGSGTIGIEAARHARGLSPGLDRAFAFERWPDHEPAVVAGLRAAVRDAARPRAPAPIIVNDRDPGAVTAIIANAERAGVRDDLEVRQGSASRVVLPDGPGWIVTNPPYGKRITGGDDPRDLYIALGRAWRAQAAGWRVAVVGPATMSRAFGLPLTAAAATRNGGLAVSFLLGTVPTTP